MVLKTGKCEECGCDFKTKYMIRVDMSGVEDDDHKKHFESTSKRSVVGWIKHILDTHDTSSVKEIKILNLTELCQNSRSHKGGDE